MKNGDLPGRGKQGWKTVQLSVHVTYVHHAQPRTMGSSRWSFGCSLVVSCMQCTSSYCRLPLFSASW